METAEVHRRRIEATRGAALLVTLWLLAVAPGCAPALVLPKPSPTAAIEALARAHDSGASDDPEALYWLAIANEEMARAGVLIEAGQMAEAAASLSAAEAHADRATHLASSSGGHAP